MSHRGTLAQILDFLTSFRCALQVSSRSTAYQFSLFFSSTAEPTPYRKGLPSIVLVHEITRRTSHFKHSWNLSVLRNRNAVLDHDHRSKSLSKRPKQSCTTTQTTNDKDPVCSAATIMSDTKKKHPPLCALHQHDLLVTPISLPGTSHIP
jgi:hypothetical protein